MLEALTFQFIPHQELSGLGSPDRIERLLSIVKTNQIVLLEGRLKSHEEAELIRKTMEEIDQKFKGVELAVLNPTASGGAFFSRVRTAMIGMLLGDRQGLTIIGPATVIREIKQDPDKIQLFTHDSAEHRRKKHEKGE